MRGGFAHMRVRWFQVVSAPSAVCVALTILACRDGAIKGNEPAIRGGESAGSIADLASTTADRAPDTSKHATPVLGVQSAAALVRSLARAAGGADGTTYTVHRNSDVSTSGTISGRIGGGEHASRDSVVTPANDLTVCAPFTQRTVPSVADGVGNAVVWLVGVAPGPADTASRRTSMTLAGCRLEPRVLRVPVGATLMVTSRDAMTSRLRFTDVAGESLRATVMFNDAGQVVPTSDVGARAGLIEVRDELHPWVRGYVVVAPHRFVALTGADGAFHFDGVPAGRYTLVVWSETLGTRTTDLRVTSGGETKVNLKY